jgi:hypothetical protein
VTQSLSGKSTEKCTISICDERGQKSRLTSALRRLGNQTITADVAKRLKNQAISRCDEWGRKIRLTSALRRIVEIRP